MNRQTPRQVPAATATGPAASAAPATHNAFPKGFLYGVATAAHQVDDNSTNSDSWVVEHVKPTTTPKVPTTPATTIITTLTTSSSRWHTTDPR